MASYVISFLCASEGLLYCLAGTEGFHAKQLATNHNHKEAVLYV